jgi:Spy/CpxP family protein refolding chaperone
MPETNETTDAGRRPLWGRRRFWVGGGILAGLAALVAVAPRAWALRGFGSLHGSHGLGAGMLKDPAGAKQHVGAAVEWALRGVNATDEQKEQARRITDRLIDRLGPLAEKHREHHQAMVGELAKPQIDREAIERLRQGEIALADEASKTLVASITDLAEVLTPEQRNELIEFVHRLHAEAPTH